MAASNGLAKIINNTLTNLFRSAGSMIHVSVVRSASTIDILIILVIILTGCFKNPPISSHIGDSVLNKYYYPLF